MFLPTLVGLSVCLAVCLFVRKSDERIFMTHGGQVRHDPGTGRPDGGAVKTMFLVYDFLTRLDK